MPIWEVAIMLKVDHLVAGYAKLPAIHDISFHVERGQIVAILGSNGVGKSTTLRAITGSIRPMSGSVVYKGKEISGLPVHKIAHLGITMVPEGRHLFPKMSIYENLLMGAFTQKDKSIKARQLEEVYSIFPILKERKNQMAGTMSGGEQQMVAIGRALMSNPEMLILDEPSLGIMPKLVNEIFEYIVKINQTGITIILVEQNAEKSLEIADYAYVLNNGEIAMEGTGPDLLNDPNVRRVYLGVD